MRRAITALVLLAAAVIGFAPAAAHAAISCPPAAGALWTATGAESGRYFAGGAYRVNNNMWNGSHGPQTIWANSASDWGVCSKQPNLGGAVETYPNVEVPYYNDNGGNAPMSKLTAMRATFTEAMPDPAAHSYIAEAAFDVWLNTWSIEVMVWTDNHGQVPFGHQVGTAVIFGQTFKVWQDGSAAFAFVLDHNEKSGTGHLLATLTWLRDHGKIPASSTVTSAQFGWEVCATGGAVLDFTMTRYSMTTLPLAYQP